MIVKFAIAALRWDKNNYMKIRFKRLYKTGFTTEEKHKLSNSSDLIHKKITFECEDDHIIKFIKKKETNISYQTPTPPLAPLPSTLLP